MMVMNVYIPNPNVYYSLWIIEEDSSLSGTIGVPPVFYSVFQSMLDSDMHVVTLSLSQCCFAFLLKL